jgi:hypothetical protein
LRDFIEVRGAGPAGKATGGWMGPGDEPAELPTELPSTPVPAAANEPRWSLWGDAEP